MATYLNPQIKYNWPVIKIDLKQRTCVSQRGHPISYDFLISTIPLPELLRIAGIDFENNNIFEFTKLINLRIGFKGVIPHSYHWLYIPEEKVDFHRVIFPKNVNKRTCPNECSSISLEYTIPKDGFLPKTSSLVNIALDYLSSAQLINLDKCLTIDVKKNITGIYSISF